MASPAQPAAPRSHPATRPPGTILSQLRSSSCVRQGVVLAGLIMTILTLAGKTGALIALAALVAAGVGAIGSSMKKDE